MPHQKIVQASEADRRGFLSCATASRRPYHLRPFTPLRQKCRDCFWWILEVSCKNYRTVALRMVQATKYGLVRTEVASESNGPNVRIMQGNIRDGFKSIVRRMIVHDDPFPLQVQGTQDRGNARVH